MAIKWWSSAANTKWLISVIVRATTELSNGYSATYCRWQGSRKLRSSNCYRLCYDSVSNKSNHRLTQFLYLFWQIFCTANGGRAIQVATSARSLNSNDTFVLKTKSECYIWVGVGASDEEEEAAKYVAGLTSIYFSIGLSDRLQYRTSIGIAVNGNNSSTTYHLNGWTLLHMLMREYSPMDDTTFAIRSSVLGDSPRTPTA